MSLRISPSHLDSASEPPSVNNELGTYPPDPLPLLREGGVQVREGRSPSLKSLPPLLEKERGIKGVRLIKNLIVADTNLKSLKY